MSKSSKKSPDATVRAEIEPEELMKQLRASLFEGAKALNGRIVAISANLTGKKYNQQDASHLAWLTKQAAQIMGEVRKLEDQEQKRLSRLTPAMVLAWLRQLDAETRARLLREAATFDSGRSVLG